MLSRQGFLLGVVLNVVNRPAYVLLGVQKHLPLAAREALRRRTVPGPQIPARVNGLLDELPGGRAFQLNHQPLDIQRMPSQHEMHVIGKNRASQNH
jgi:hypothetical protein